MYVLIVVISGAVIWHDSVNLHVCVSRLRTALTHIACQQHPASFCFNNDVTPPMGLACAWHVFCSTSQRATWGRERAATITVVTIIYNNTVNWNIILFHWRYERYLYMGGSSKFAVCVFSVNILLYAVVHCTKHTDQLIDSWLDTALVIDWSIFQLS